MDYNHYNHYNRIVHYFYRIVHYDDCPLLSIFINHPFGVPPFMETPTIELEPPLISQLVTAASGACVWQLRGPNKESIPCATRSSFHEKIINRSRNGSFSIIQYLDLFIAHVYEQTPGMKMSLILFGTLVRFVLWTLSCSDQSQQRMWKATGTMCLNMRDSSWLIPSCEPFSDLGTFPSDKPNLGQVPRRLLRLANW